MASNLYQYYRSLGQQLPSIEQRREKYGLGEGYMGSAEQNKALLAQLQSGAVPSQSMAQMPTTPTTPQQTATAPQTAAMGAAMPSGWQGQMAEIEKYRTGQMEQAGISDLRASIGGLRKQVGETEKLLESLRPDIESRTQDYLVPEAYRRRMEAVEREPLTQQLAGLTRGLGIEEQALAGRLSEVDYRTQLASQLMREELANQRSLAAKTASGPSRTETRDTQRQEIASFFAYQGTREEAEEAAKAMIGQGYPPDVVYEELERQFAEEPEEPTKATEKDKVKGNIRLLIGQNASIEDINNYIYSTGFDPNDFADILRNYPEKEMLSPLPERTGLMGLRGIKS